MKKFYIKTLGCKTNAIESQIISENLKKLGFIETNKNEAEIYILNSCT
ncbi:TPA: tRNA (N(6)-L-threonylcarbamoyladenosine(37)-C(2))-methylthiotransferase MtaB, partial [Candidatus Galligastranaerophilus intestinigallinarum]|nr:tRNA (N(6)-L-threonylcarbamoyladenosine(37)-C(2))-methylthiotransferase MtaB [Candidatus Galligastranaerophilus intestinigallinarum]